MLPGRKSPESLQDADDVLEKDTGCMSKKKKSYGRKKKRRSILKTVAGWLLMILAVCCLGGAVFVGYRMVQKQQTERAALEAARIAEEQARKEEEARLLQEAEQKAAEEAQQKAAAEAAAAVQVPETVQAGDMVLKGGYQAQYAADMAAPAETDVASTISLLMDVSSNTILNGKDVETRIYPASMTKILTVLVAAEHVTNLDDTFTMTSDITGYCLTNGCSAAGFVGGEVIPVRDLFYGTILPSGGEAAVGLATYVAGSHEAFVELMNAKLAELGLSATTHMTNCVGIFDENHYSTALDIAMILKAAVENDFCREVLSTKVYTTAVTEQNPEGIILSNWFLRRIEDKDCGGQVLCAKTGFVAQSGDCAASYGISAAGKPYICVTVNTYSSWRCIYDHVAMYKLYAR